MRKRKRYVIWSEKEGAWWLPGLTGYTRSLEKAGRYSQAHAEHIAQENNRYLEGQRRFWELAMPDPVCYLARSGLL